MMENKFRMHEWIAALSFVVFFLLLNSTKPFLFPRESVRWYHYLFLGFITFLFYHKELKFQYLGKYKKLYYLIFSIIFINIVIYPNYYMQNIGLATTIISVLILTPFLSNPNARKVLYFTFIYIAVMKILLVYQFSLDEIYLREMSGKGKDKNYVGLLLSMVSIMLISRFMISKYLIKKIGHPFRNLMMIVFILLSLYSLLMCNSRSALLSFIASIIILIYLVTKNFGVNTVLLKAIFISSFLLIIGLQLYPQMADKYYFIGENYSRIIEFTTGKRNDINNRSFLLYSGIEFIKKKPITGYGIGGEQRISKSNFHNTYLTFWVNYGIFGILFLILLIKYYWDEVKFQINNIKQGGNNIYDVPLLLSLIPFIFMFFTLGMTTIVFFMTSFLSSFTYRRMVQNKLTHNHL